jgi:hypothetical protein
MKKICIIGLLAGICGLANVANATTIATPITINAPLNDLPNETLGGVKNTPYMEYNNAYEWGISLGSGVQLASATITVNATLYNESSGTLFVSLLDSTPVSGISWVSGNTLSSSDYWGTPATGSAANQYFTYHNGTKHTAGYWSVNNNSLGKPEYVSLGGLSYPTDDGISETIPLTTAELADLNSYLASTSPNTGGGFNIGFDPNCTYALTGLSFSYTTVPVSVPDTAMTVLLLGASLVGLEMFRRKFVPAKIQA